MHSGPVDHRCPRRGGNLPLPRLFLYYVQQITPCFSRGKGLYRQEDYRLSLKAAERAPSSHPVRNHQRESAQTVAARAVR